MDQYRTASCLFCTTGKEAYVVQAVEKHGWGRAIFPQRLRTMRVGKQWTETYIPLLPGYVFVYFDGDQVAYEKLATIEHVLRVLDYGAGQHRLAGRDLEFADWIWRQGGKINAMKALQIGDWIEITDGMFKQLHGTILRMDRRRRSFLVSLEGAGAIQKIWLTYEVVEKREPKP